LDRRGFFYVEDEAADSWNTNCFSRVSFLKQFERQTMADIVNNTYLEGQEIDQDGIDLKGKGFPLIGGRLDYIGGQTVAALVYMKGKHLINVFVMPEDRGIPIWKQVRGYHVLHWKVGDLGYWAVSDVNPQDFGPMISDYTDTNFP
jgi:hypothetical protein